MEHSTLNTLWQTQANRGARSTRRHQRALLKWWEWGCLAVTQTQITCTHFPSQEHGQKNNEPISEAPGEKCSNDLSFWMVTEENKQPGNWLWSSDRLQNSQCCQDWQVDFCRRERSVHSSVFTFCTVVSHNPEIFQMWKFYRHSSDLCWHQKSCFLTNARANNRRTCGEGTHLHHLVNSQLTLFYSRSQRSSVPLQAAALDFDSSDCWISCGVTRTDIMTYHISAAIQKKLEGYEKLKLFFLLFPLKSF